MPALHRVKKPGSSLHPGLMACICYTNCQVHHTRPPGWFCRLLGWDMPSQACTTDNASLHQTHLLLPKALHPSIHQATVSTSFLNQVKGFVHWSYVFSHVPPESKGVRVRQHPNAYHQCRHQGCRRCWDPSIVCIRQNMGLYFFRHITFKSMAKFFSLSLIFFCSGKLFIPNQPSLVPFIFRCRSIIKCFDFIPTGKPGWSSIFIMSWNAQNWCPYGSMKIKHYFDPGFMKLRN